MLGLPDDIAACLFDMDGVLTKTAAVHADAWKQMFDEFLRRWARVEGAPFVPFDIHGDYDEYVDGKPRSDGVRDFLRSRHIELPEGDEGDPAEVETIHGLGNRKNALVLRHIDDAGVEVFEGSLRYLDAVSEAGLRRAVVSSSANARDVLAAAGIAGHFEVCVDGKTIEARGLRGKPDPDTFLDAANQLDVLPAHAAVFEDALSGVAAGRAGRFGFVVGVDREGQAAALVEHGADRVVGDLAELLVPEETSL
jgi:beta-phosphoglucomutase family hydrolase